MNHDESATQLRQTIVAAIAATAPDVAPELADLDPDLDLFEEFGLDSMDRLNIMTSLAQSTGVDVPDDRYPHLTTLNRLITHLSTPA